MTKSEIMKRAWGYAKELAAQSGLPAKRFLSHGLKQAHSEAKRVTLKAGSLKGFKPHRRGSSVKWISINNNNLISNRIGVDAQEIAGRKEGFRRFLETRQEDVEVPLLVVDGEGGYYIADGRHRFNVLEEMFGGMVPVSIIR